MSNLELTLLGAPRVHYRETALALQNKHLALVAYLVLQGRPCPRDELIRLLWGEGRHSNLRTALYKLRKHPGADAWLQDDDPVTVRARTDVAALERARGAERLPDAVLARLDALVAAGDGELLAGLEPPTSAYAAWLDEQRDWSADLVAELLFDGARDLFDRDDHDRARGYVARLLARDPLHERAHRLLMRIEHASGHPENARRAFERCREALREGAGAEPEPETLALRRRLLGLGSRGARGALLRPGDEVPGRAARLVGRGALLERIERTARERPVLLHGFGGVGKTALAAEFAAARLADGNATVLWLRGGWGNAAELLETVARTLVDPDAATGVGALATALARERVALCVIDDAWNAEAVQGLRARLPGGIPLLVTARQRVAGLERIDVDVLPRADARQLLAAEAGRVLEDGAADRLCDLVGNHPFALRLAGARLRSDGVTPQRLAARIGAAPHDLRTPRSWRAEGRESVGALLQTSLDALSDDAYDAFLAIGALDSGGATAGLLARILRRDADRTEEALIELHTRALAERMASPGSDAVRYALHDLAHAFARQNGTLRVGTVVRACRAFVAAHADDFEILDAEIANVLGALEAARETDDRDALIDIVATLAIGSAYFAGRGHTPRSLELLAVAVRWATDAGDAERAHGLAGRLGDAFRAQYGRYPEALTAYRESARLARLAGDTGREAVLTSMCGVTRHLLGESPREDFERAQELAERAGDDLALGQVLQHRSFVAGAHGDWAAMERLSARAAATARRLRAAAGTEGKRADHNLFAALLNLGEAKRHRGDFEGGVAARREALAIAAEHGNRLWRARALHELGEMHLDAGREAAAERYLGEALELYETDHNRAEAGRVQALLERTGSRRVDA